MFKFIFDSILKNRVKWSNFRNKDNLVDCEVDEVVTRPIELASIGKKIDAKFTYQYDGPTELFDSMRFPAQCYTDYKNGLLKDDCDGFHAALYHVAEKNSFDSYLLTYIPTKLSKSHTVLLVKHEGYYYVFDYRVLRAKSKDINEIIKTIETKCKVNIISYNFVKFVNGEYVVVNEV